MSIPLQFVSLYDGQEVFVWSDCLLDLCMDFLVGNMCDINSELNFYFWFGDLCFCLCSWWLDIAAGMVGVSHLDMFVLAHSGTCCGLVSMLWTSV